MITKRLLASAVSTLAVATSSGCGGHVEYTAPVPRGEVAAKGPEAPEAPSTAASVLYTASRDDRFSVVRVDAGAKTVTAISQGLPEGFVPSSLYASADNARFFVSGNIGERYRVYAGSPTAWVQLAESLGGGALYIRHVAPDLSLVALHFTNAGGGTIDERVVRFDGSLARSLGTDNTITAVGAGFYSTASSHENTSKWSIYGDGQLRGELADAIDRNQPLLVLDDRLVFASDRTCRQYSIQTPSTPLPSFACTSVIGTLALDGDRVLRLGSSTERELLTRPPSVPKGELLASTGEVTAFVALREHDRSQTLEFLRSDGGHASYDPGQQPDGKEWSGWTRVVAGNGRICAVLNIGECPPDFHGTCKTSFVDLVCSDGAKIQQRRFHRDLAASAPAVEFALTPDARFLLFKAGPELHRIDTMTLAESILETPYVLGTRDGDLPTPMGRPSL